MPLMELIYPSGALAPEARAALVDELVTLVLRAEGAPDTEFFRNLAWVYLREMPEDAVFVAGRPVTEHVFRLEASVPEGSVSEQSKHEFVAAATAALLEAAGLHGTEGLRVWVLIREVPEGNWGAAGHVINYDQLRAAAMIEAEGVT